MDTIWPPVSRKPTNIFGGGQVMDDRAIRELFEQPTKTHHRGYEALRAVFVDQRCHKQVAEKS